MNPAREALSRAVNAAIARGEPRLFNVPNVSAGNKDIPAGKVLIAEPRDLTPDCPRVKKEVLDAGKMRVDPRITVRLVAAFAGWNIAGSMMRWDNGCYAVQWESRDGATHGRRYRTFQEALNEFNRITA